ncbi:MAG TPA: DUF1634 domain-containing protein [Bryobacteraceae bacterium]|nr:DUF1634 domain-containing protein [Bryobacteraceae bacterium]
MTDVRIEKAIGTLLQIGVLTAAVVVLAGGVWLLAGSGRSVPRYNPFRGEPDQLRSAHRVVGSLAHPSPAIVIQFGLILLIATPVARVVFSLAAFAWERDWTYVVITLIVLAVLTYSLALPHH